MLKHNNGVLPELDERREIWKLLKFLTMRRRLEWLKWCCEQVSHPSVTTFIVQNDGSVSAVFWDAMTLFWGSGLTMTRAGERLVEMVRKRG